MRHLRNFESIKRLFLMKRVIVVGSAILATTVVSAQSGNAKANWRMDCVVCHGSKGRGASRMGRYLGAPDYQDPKVQASFTDEAAFKDIKEGVRKDGRTKMKPFGSELTDQDIRDLVQYVRSFKKDK